MPDIKLKLRTTVRTNPITGNYNAIALRIEKNAPGIAKKLIQDFLNTMRDTVPGPPGKAWWYIIPPNPKTGKYVPIWEQYIRTGGLKRSIPRFPIVTGPKSAGTYLSNEYAAFVNNGTRFMPPQPFWDEALAEVANVELPKAVRNWIDRGKI